MEHRVDHDELGDDREEDQHFEVPLETVAETGNLITETAIALGKGIFSLNVY